MVTASTCRVVELWVAEGDARAVVDAVIGGCSSGDVVDSERQASGAWRRMYSGGLRWCDASRIVSTPGRRALLVANQPGRMEVVR